MKKLWKILPWPLKGMAILIPVAIGGMAYIYKTDADSIYILPLFAIMLILAFIHEGMMRRR